MSDWVIPRRHCSHLEVDGSAQRFPVGRVYCVGRNYAAHVREMGLDPQREPPFFFIKPCDSVAASGREVPFPPRTSSFQHEIELVVAIGTAGRDIPAAAALEHVWGYAVGNDLTRRDLQLAARDRGRPWDTGKTMDVAAVIGPVHPAARVGRLDRGRIWLAVNGAIRQDADLGQMIWSVPEIIAELSTFYTLRPGDLIMTGTPEGVGSLSPGDRVTGGVARLGEFAHLVAA